MTKSAAPRTLPPLLQVCIECDGTGFYQSPEWKEFHLTHHDLSAVPDSEWPTAPEEIGCEECEGSGKVPTEDGKEIMALLNWRDKK